MRTKLIAAFLLAAAAVSSFAQSKWAYLGPDHRLRYGADDRGNRIMDFSFAGYRGGGVRLPVVPVAKTLGPIEGDNTAQIQAALNEVARLAPDSKGFRGAVLLQPGTYTLGGMLLIEAGGVVLRGSGSTPEGTVIKLTGAPHRFLEIRGAGSWHALGKPATITDSYIPSGADSFQMDDPTGFRVGDAVLVRRPVTEAWVHFMGMDTLVRDGKPQTWIKAGTAIQTDRTIREVKGNRITLDVPLSDSFDAKLLSPPGASVVKYEFPGRIAEAGVESLRVIAPGEDVPITGPQYTLLRIRAAADVWAKDLVVEETQNAISIDSSAKRVTLDGLRIIHSLKHSGAAAPADFAVSGTQVLLNRCSVDGEGTWPVVTQATVTGPVVILNFSGTAAAGVSPHQRWATGVLVDGARLPNVVSRTPAIAFSNRKTMGSGHGWDVGWAVGWNVAAPYLLVEQPPGAINWCIGCIGEPVVKPDMPQGIYESRGRPVEPASLYLEQLRERLGDAALANIGYGEAERKSTTKTPSALSGS